jgi:ribose transport system ATP-binding protein
VTVIAAGNRRADSDIGFAARIEHISKRFPGTRALIDAGLSVRTGEIHGLIGGNGSGKSTLIKIISGVYQADPGGTIEVGDSVVDAAEITPEFARSAGVRVVHQDLGVFEHMSVAENLALGAGFEMGLGGRIRWARLRRRAEALIEQFEIDARSDALVAELSQSTRALIAIARACQDMALHEGGGRGLLILDEPTASLPAHEVELLLNKLRSYADRGASIVYVSHRLDEVFRITDRVTALRDGRVVSTVATGALREHDLVELIVGAAVGALAPTIAAPPAAARTVLDVDRLSVGCLRDVSFSVSAGEVVGIAGLLGSGRSTLLRCLFGIQQPRSGGLRIDGVTIRPRTVREAIRSGIAYVPENRSDAGFFDLPIEHNLIAARVAEYRSGPRLRHRRARQDAMALIREFGVKAASSRAELATLSGGNQQKVILARWLSTEPTLLLLDEPDHGVDVGARGDIWRMVRSAAGHGMAVLVVTSDLEELARAVDRAVVIAGGSVIADVAHEQLTAKRLTQLVYFRGSQPPEDKESADV